MRRPTNEVIAVLNAKPLGTTVETLTVWSNGRVIRRYQKQDEYYRKYSAGSASPARGCGHATHRAFHAAKTRQPELTEEAFCRGEDY